MSSDDKIDDEASPLEDLYVDADAIDEERIRDALTDIVAIDRDTGNPRFYEEFETLNSKRKFTAVLLYRRALSALGDLKDDESVGAGSSYFADFIGVDGSTIRHAAKDLDFVTNEDEQDGYLIPVHNIKRAVEFLENTDS
ncbi:hypothetical protein ACFQGT_02625 [Natrialbaceae archaeon GCM10025810]|uniref:hypothetical protein n=1 Tax=Halovalidus salilacus TaxID=3075124 RepID=UPI0036123A28